MQSTDVNFSNEVDGVMNSGVESKETSPSSPPSEATAAPDIAAKVEEARSRAAQCFAEKRYADARKALEEADALESGKGASVKKFLHNLRSEWDSVFPKDSVAGQPQSSTPMEASAKAANLYSKMAVAAGLLPGGLLNFAAVLLVQISMIWKIAKIYHKPEGKDRIRGSILSLIGAALPTSLGHGVTYAVAAIPAMILGNLLYFIVTPVLAYAMTQAVGKTFIMHFESGGTLLTFDPKSFQEYFLQEFKKSGGTVS